MLNITGLSIKEAEKILKEVKLELSVEGIVEENKEDFYKENTIIKEQTPTEGIKVNKGNIIFVKTKKIKNNRCIYLIKTKFK